MKAIVQDTYGDTDVLRLDDVATPEIGPADVLVRVHAAGVDPGVWHLMTGRPYLVRALGFGLRAPKVRVRGRDLAGVVEAVGADVTRFAVGDEVYGTSETGTFAELAVSPEKLLAKKPTTLTFEQAATVPISGVTALQAVRDVVKVGAGQKLLVIGAGGGVGSFTVQIATSYGVEVTGVCSAGNADLVRSLGAVDVIDYAVNEIDSRGPVFDAVVDTAGNRPLSLLRRALTESGVIGVVGGEAGKGAVFGGFERLLAAPLTSMVHRQKARPVTAKENSADLEELARLIDSGAVTPAVGRVYPLADAPQAIADNHAGHARGKSVIRILPA
jgi:NADPH:quinone reductase-like Zn-dependent oxidoreductase